MKAKVLIIEDNEQNLYLMTFILEKAGYLVIQARNGPEGIRLALDEGPPLVLLDIQLPGMDGYEVLREWQHHATICDIPIVAITSYATPGDRERILAAGCTGYLEKPINPDTFVGEVSRYGHPGVSDSGKKP